PLSEGVDLYMKQRGITGTPGDFARFLRFNLFETSIRQKVALGGPEDAGGRPDVSKGRRLGHKLFANALPDADTFRDALQHDTSDEWNAIRKTVTELTANPEQLSDAEVLTLCDAIAARRKESNAARENCAGTAGASVVQGVIPIDHVIARHLESLKPESLAAQFFVYGHTHASNFNWAVKWGGNRT